MKHTKTSLQLTKDQRHTQVLLLLHAKERKRAASRGYSRHSDSFMGRRGGGELNPKEQYHIIFTLQNTPAHETVFGIFFVSSF